MTFICILTHRLRQTAQPPTGTGEAVCEVCGRNVVLYYPVSASGGQLIQCRAVALQRCQLSPIVRVRKPMARCSRPISECRYLPAHVLIETELPRNTVRCEHDVPSIKYLDFLQCIVDDSSHTLKVRLVVRR